MSEYISSMGPYLHEKAYHFRQDVSNQLSTSEINRITQDFSEASSRLEAMISTLRNEANAFLSPWGGDYKAASKEIFGNNDSDKAIYKKVLNEIINSIWFIETVKRRKSRKDFLDGENVQKAQKILEEFGIQLASSELQGKTVTDLSNIIVQSIHLQQGKKQINLDSGNLKKGMEKLLNKEINQKYYRNIDTFKKRLTEALMKNFKTQVNWEGVFRETKDRFMQEFPNNKKAEEFIDKIRNDFIHAGNGLKSIQYANISGFISENIWPTIINNDDFTKILINISGDVDEATLTEEARRFAMHASGKFGLQISTSQISKMGHRNVDKQQSGTDWLIVNQHGKMIRAQVKNSTQIVEELRKAETSRPQTIHLQSDIKYNTLKRNLQSYSVGTIGGLSSEDWMLLDYLIVNMLWIRAGGGVTKDRGGEYRSGVSGIQELVNQLLTKEVGYFLGVSLAPEDKANAVNTVMGGSNIFFVIDNLLLYPTWMIIESIKRQLEKLKEALMKIHVVVSSSYIPSRKEYINTKEWAKKEDDKKRGYPWSSGMSYGETVLEVGRNYAALILESTSAKVNLNININQIINEIYEEGLTNFI